MEYSEKCSNFVVSKVQNLYVMEKLYDNSRDVKIEYTNRVIPMMEAYYGDIVYDLEYIDELRPDECRFFIIRPKGTHNAKPAEYDEVRDDTARVFGNYVVIKVFRNEEGLYGIKDWDKLETMSYDTEDETLIQRYKNFLIK